MNTGFLGPAVATVLTVYGIETSRALNKLGWMITLQQYLPFTVLKRFYSSHSYRLLLKLQQYLPFTVLKLCTAFSLFNFASLQQYLPFTVLKHWRISYLLT